MMADLRKQSTPPVDTIADAMAHPARYTGSDLFVLQMMHTVSFDADSTLTLPSGVRLQGPYNPKGD